MSQLAEMPRDGRRTRRTFWEWIRHHATSVLSTAVDFTVMFVAVKVVHLKPVLATVVGASFGSVTNFAVNRSFTYRAGAGRASGQVWRFVVVSATSLGLNALGEWTFFSLLGLQFMLARVITAIIVSNGWNYPMLRFFVFSRRST